MRSVVIVIEFCQHPLYAIVVSSGDSDGLMSGICKSKNIPMDTIGSISEVANVLPGLFK